MEAEITGRNKRPLVGIYTPELEGFYFGELVGQILILCRIKNYRVSVIKTGGYGEFTSAVASEAMDMVIVLCNAINYKLARDLLEKGKSVVSVSFDYFPLDIPFVTTDNEAGVELAFNHLLDQGHKRILFIGNLKNFDIRKRYEAFCDQIEKHGLDEHDDDLIQVDDDLLSGGYQAADVYMESRLEASAVICGTSMNGIGFSRKLEMLNPDLKNLLSIVSFDAVSLIPVLDFEITSIDQNLNLVAHKALSIVESKKTGGESKHHHSVQPKLISKNTEFMKSEEAYLATSFELAELYNANYMKSILCNISEWSQSIANSKLDSIMMLQPLFRNLLSFASVSRTVTGKSGAQYLAYTKLVSAQGATKIDVNNQAAVSKIHAFPFNFKEFDPSECDTAIHIPRFVDGKVWGFISTYGKTENSQSACSYTGFVTFLNYIVELMSFDLTGVNIAARANAVLTERPDDDAVEGEIRWNKTTNEALWDESAMEILGFVSEIEQKIYKYMALNDRLAADCVGVLRDYLLDEQIGEMPVQVKFRHKSRELIVCDLWVGEVEENRNLVIKIKSSVSEG